MNDIEWIWIIQGQEVDNNGLPLNDRWLSLVDKESGKDIFSLGPESSWPQKDAMNLIADAPKLLEQRDALREAIEEVIAIARDDNPYRLASELDMAEILENALAAIDNDG